MVMRLRKKIREKKKKLKKKKKKNQKKKKICNSRNRNLFGKKSAKLQEVLNFHEYFLLFIFTFLFGISLDF